MEMSSQGFKMEKINGFNVEFQKKTSEFYGITAIIKDTFTEYLISSKTSQIDLFDKVKNFTLNKLVEKFFIINQFSSKSKILVSDLEILIEKVGLHYCRTGLFDKQKFTDIIKKRAINNKYYIIKEV